MSRARVERLGAAAGDAVGPPLVPTTLASVKDVVADGPVHGGKGAAAAPLRPARVNPEAWASVRNLLVVRLDNLGDVLMTTPAWGAVRRSLPGVRITALLSPAGAALSPHLDVVDEVLAFEAPWVKGRREDGALATDVLGERARGLIEQLARRRFDAAIIFTVCTQTALPAALTTLLAGIPLRLAYSRENPYDLLSDWVPETDEVADGMRHEVERQLALVAAVGLAEPSDNVAPRLHFAFHAADRDRLGERLAHLGVRLDRPFVVVHVGATAPSRRYPPERFGQAVREIMGTSGCLAVFTGDSSERALVARAMAQLPDGAISLAGELDLGSLAVLIADARLLVANNTGPVHMAAALGTPVVDLYAQTNPQHTPWNVTSRVLFQQVPCRHCLSSVCPQGHHACLQGVPAAAVAEAALQLIAEPRTVSIADAEAAVSHGRP